MVHRLRLRSRSRHSFVTESDEKLILKTPGGILVYQTSGSPVTRKRIKGRSRSSRKRRTPSQITRKRITQQSQTLVCYVHVIGLGPVIKVHLCNSDGFIPESKTEPWLLEYQVLPSRSDPHKQMSYFGGYAMSGIRISTT